MGLNNILGSPTALSLAATNDLPMTIIAVAATGVMLTVTSAVFLYKKYELFEEKKHRKAIEAINRLHKRFLERIVIPGYDDIQGFPPIFKLTTNENSSAADSLHFTDDEVRDIGKNLPHGADIALSIYRESVLNAILKLKDYYLSRNDRNDLTAGVLSYLLYMLETKCLSFQGYAYDIAYLEAITQFIDAYASMRGYVNTQHFTRLQPVYSYLTSAKKYLEKHRESLSLEELLAELRDCCSNTSNKLIRHLVKMTIHQDYIPLADTVTLDELQKNILRRHYVSAHIQDIEILADAELNLPNSIFKEWIISLSDYYLKSLRPISSLKENTIIAPDFLFRFIPWAKKTIEIQNPSKADAKELKKLEQLLNQIQALFKNSPNFLNTKLDSSSKKSKFIVITEQTEILQRITVISEFARLIHSIISMQYLCTHLLKSIKQLGDIYVKDHAHFREIFGVLNQLLGVIKSNIKLNLNSFSEIEQANQNTMRLEKDELFSRDVVSTLKTIKQITTNLGAQVIEYRNKPTKPSDPTEASVNYEMLSVANLLSKLYPPTEQPVICFAAKTDGKDALDTEISLPKDKASESNPVQLSESHLNNHNDTAEHLHSLTTQIYKQIKTIQQESPKDPRLSQYRLISLKLNSLQAKSIVLLEESGKIQERLDKAQKTSELIHLLCQDTLDFLSLTKQQRAIQASAFVKRIHEELVKPTNNSFIDLHSNSASKFIYTHVCSLGIFRTDTRKSLSQLEEACDGLSSQYRANAPYIQF